MKKDILIFLAIVILASTVIYQGFDIRDTKNKANQAFLVINAMGTVDENGVSGFDKLVVITLNKLNAAQKK